MNKGHSQAGEHRWTDKSGHKKNPTEQGALTSWRVQPNGQVRIQKEDQVRDTHQLESTARWTGQDTERIQPSKGHSRTGECRQMESQDMKRIQPSERHSQTGECRWTSQDTVRTE